MRPDHHNQITKENNLIKEKYMTKNDFLVEIKSGTKSRDLDV